MFLSNCVLGSEDSESNWRWLNDLTEDTGDLVIENIRNAIQDDTSDVPVGTHKVEFWEYSRSYYPGEEIYNYITSPKYLGLGPWIDPFLFDPDGVFYASKSVNICGDFAKWEYEKEHGKGTHARSFYMRVFTEHETVEIWNYGGGCAIWGPVERKCRDVRLLGEILVCKQGPDVMAWDLETLEKTEITWDQLQ